MTISIEIYPGKGLSVQLSAPADAPAILLANSLDTRLSHVCGHSIIIPISDGPGVFASELGRFIEAVK